MSGKKNWIISTYVTNIYIIGMCLIIGICLPLVPVRANAQQQPEQQGNVQDQKKHDQSVQERATSDRAAQEQGQPSENSSGNLKLDDIVVAATRTQKIVADVPVNASVVTREEIQEQNIKTIDEALNYLDGVFNKRSKGFMDTGQKINLRGLPGANRVLVLLNGQPLNTGDSGDVPWDVIPIDSVERVEVIRGPSSALHGGNAMAGVINIITHKPKKMEAWTEYSYGTDNTHILKVHFGDQWAERFSFFTTYEKRKTDGYRSNLVTKSIPTTPPNNTTPVTGFKVGQNNKGNTVYIIGDTGENGWDEDILHLQFGFEPTPLTRLSLGYSYSETKYSYEDWKTYLRDANGNPVYSGGVAFDPANQANKVSISESNFLSGPGVEKTNIFTASFDQQIGDHLSLSLRGGVTDQSENWYITPKSGTATSAGGAGEISDTPNSTITAEVQTDWTGFTNHILTAGLSTRWENAENAKHNLTNWRDEDSKAEKTATAEGKVNTWALFLQEEWDPFDQLALFAGGRVDNWQTKDGRSEYLDTATNTTVKKSFPNRSDSYFSPKLSFLYKPVKETGIRGSWGKAYRGPSVFELYRQWKYGTTTYEPNPDLDPETISSWEMGFDQYLNQNSFLRFTYFYNDINDLITSVTDPANSKIKKQQNAGQAVSKGMEFSLDHRISQDWGYLFSYTYTDARIKKDKSNPANEDKRITGIPENMFNTGLTYHHKKVRGSIFGRYVGKTYSSGDNSDTNEGYYTCYDPFFVVNLNLSYQVCKHTEVTLAVDNLFDKEYYQYYLSPGRSVFAKLKVGI